MQQFVLPANVPCEIFLLLLLKKLLRGRGLIINELHGFLAKIALVLFINNATSKPIFSQIRFMVKHFKNRYKYTAFKLQMQIKKIF
jgi:hypothetical protein